MIYILAFVLVALMLISVLWRPIVVVGVIVLALGALQTVADYLSALIH